MGGYLLLGFCLSCWRNCRCYCRYYCDRCCSYRCGCAAGWLVRFLLLLLYSYSFMLDDSGVTAAIPLAVGLVMPWRLVGFHVIIFFSFFWCWQLNSGSIPADFHNVVLTKPICGVNSPFCFHEIASFVYANSQIVCTHSQAHLRLLMTFCFLRHTFRLYFSLLALQTHQLSTWVSSSSFDFFL